MHIGFGQNTVSSLYGHQKGDHMKTIGFSHKKHKANESQEKMTVTSGKDVCRKIGHSDEVDGENQENTYIHDSFALDASYANYIRETVPKTVWSNDYLRELWDENAKYLKSIRESKNGNGGKIFNDKSKNSFWERRIAVSYTHLDVYKRQKLIGEDGIFYAEICAWTSAAVLLFISYMIIIRKYKE